MSSAAPQPTTDAPQPEEVPWWLKYAGRGMGTFGGIGESPNLRRRCNSIWLIHHTDNNLTIYKSNSLFPNHLYFSLQWPWLWDCGPAYRFLLSA